MARRFLTGSARRGALARARRGFSGRQVATVGVGGDRGLQIRIDSSLGTAEIASAAVNRKFRVILNRIFRRAAARMTDRAKKLSRPTWETGAFASSWRARVVESAGQLRLAVQLENPVPYAGFVHRRGQRGRTVVNAYIRPMVEQVAREVDEEIAAAAPEFADAIAEGILSRRIAS